MISHILEQVGCIGYTSFDHMDQRSVYKARLQTKKLLTYSLEQYYTILRLKVQPKAPRRGLKNYSHPRLTSPFCFRSSLCGCVSMATARRSLSRTVQRGNRVESVGDGGLSAHLRLGYLGGIVVPLLFDSIGDFK